MSMPSETTVIDEKEDEVELRLSAKKIREILEAGIGEVLNIEGSVLDFKLLDGRAVIVLKT
jgi:hypothetical protein